MKNVYLREVLLGQGQNVVMWLDENLGKRSLYRHLRWIQLANRHKDPFNSSDEFVHFIYTTHAEIALAYLQSVFFKKLSKNGSEFKLVQSMVRMNYREFVRKGKQNKTKRLDPRHAGMGFYIDLHEFFSKNYREYWES